MLKKLGISFLIVFPLVIAVAILFNASLPKPLFFGLFMLSAVCIPLGASFWAMFTNERKRKNIKLIFLIIWKAKLKLNNKIKGFSVFFLNPKNKFFSDIIFTFNDIFWVL
jgi:hypothetical protein